MPGALLHLEPFAGAAGDMVLGALCDLGVPAAVVDQALAAVDLSGVHLALHREQRQGMTGLRAIFVDDAGVPIDPLERGEHPHADHVAHAALHQRIARSALADPVRTRALAIYARLAEAEAQVHGVEVEAVALHELGAPDTLADVVGVAAGLAHLQPAQISVGSVPLGSGQVHTTHGLLPAPSPATVQLLRGLPVHGVALAHENVTPTGAAILACVADRTGPLPAGVLRGVGVGLGHRDPPGRPNLLRALLLEPPAIAPRDDDAMFEVAANLDDESGERIAHAVQRLLELGCADAWVSAATMKKGRPASVLHALVDAPLRDAACRLILAETSSLGLRLHQVERVVLTRRQVEVATPYGAVRVKLALDGERVIKAKPEFADCQRLAAAAGVALRQVQDAARRAVDAKVAP